MRDKDEESGRAFDSGAANRAREISGAISGRKTGFSAVSEAILVWQTGSEKKLLAF